MAVRAIRQRRHLVAVPAAMGEHSAAPARNRSDWQHEALGKVGELAEGNTIARRLFEEYPQRGHPGQEQIVRVYVRRLRQAFPSGPARAHALRRGRDRLDHPPPRPPPRRRRPAAQGSPRPNPGTATAAEPVRAFAEPMNDRRGRELKDWITRVQQDQVPALRSFANGLLQGPRCGSRRPAPELQRRRGGGPQQQNQDDFSRSGDNAPTVRRPSASAEVWL